MPEFYDETYERLVSAAEKRDATSRLRTALQAHRHLRADRVL